MAKTSIFLLVKNIKFILAAPFQKNYLDEKDWWHYQHCIFCCVCKSIFFSRFSFLSYPFYLVQFSGFLFLRRILDRRRIFGIPPLAQLSLLLFSCVCGFFFFFLFLLQSYTVKCSTVRAFDLLGTTTILFLS